MTVVDRHGHWHKLGKVDVRLDEGLVIAYDIHGYIVAMERIEDVEATDA